MFNLSNEIKVLTSSQEFLKAVAEKSFKKHVVKTNDANGNAIYEIKSGMNIEIMLIGAEAQNFRGLADITPAAKELR